MREPRLGDDIDDFCVRCKRVTNHNIVSVVQGVPAKVRCRSCHSDHDFRHENAPPPKVDLRKQTLFNEVLKKVNPGGDGAGTGAAATETDSEVGLEVAAANAEIEAEAVPEVVEAAVEEAPRPKKAKARS